MNYSTGKWLVNTRDKMWMRQEEQVYMHPQHPQQQTLQHHGIIGTDERAHYRRSNSRDMPGPSNPRALRNMAEKQRRDNLNTNISMMGELVPAVAESPKKMDKISILRLAAAFLRMNYAFGRGKVDFLPRELGELDLEQFIVDNLIDSWGFFIVVTTAGKIVYVSRKVQDHLGHTQKELLGHSLYNFVHREDHDELTKNLTPDELQGTMASSPYPSTQIADVANDSSNSSEDSASLGNERKPFREQRRSFELRMLHRTASRREHTQYEYLEISGVLRLADACKSAELNATRTKHRGISSTSNDIIFVGVAWLLTKRPITAISIMDANKNEYVTRHLVDGRIIYCDHRVSVVTGYLSEEVSGLSAFTFMHNDDYQWTIIALSQMYYRAETCGSSCYRLRSKTGEFIYLRTHGYLEIDKNTQTVISFVCINTLVPEEEGIQLVTQMKKRFTPTLSETTKSMIQNKNDSCQTLPALPAESQQSNWKKDVEDPSMMQLEDAITHLVSHLSSSVSEERLPTLSVQNEQYEKAVIISQHLPPAAAQASKIGIKKIDHYLVVQGKGNRTPKQESKTNNKQQAHADEKQENSRSSGKTLSTNKTQEVLDGSIQDVPDEAASIIANESTVEPCVNVPSDLRTSHLDVSTGINILNAVTAVEEPVNSASSTLCDNNSCEVKVEHSIDIFEDQQEPVIEYLEDNVVENGVTSDSESRHSYSLKRIYSEENLKANSNKKRRGSVPYRSTDTNEEQQNGSYVDCGPPVNEEFSELSTDFSQYNDINSQSLKVTDSPSSTLNEVNVDYQQVDSSMPLLPLNPNDEFIDLHDLKDDSLLSLGLDANPDLITKMLDDPRYVPIFENTFNETKMQQRVVNNAISNELIRTHIQLGNRMALQASEINVLAQYVKDPALQAKRGSLTSLQAEHTMQKQILETLQQDHRNIQINIKHNIDV